MADNQDRINLLHQKLDFLIQRQDSFQKEISDLRKEIESLQRETFPVSKAESVSFTQEKPIPEKPRVHQEIRVAPKPIAPRPEPKIKKPSNWEKFIGENLINKIGVLVLIIGVGIGAKYAIDNELISPLTRIVLGYLMGLGLLGFALKLKKKFESFSAVLLSGSMAIMYFITFLAYSLYGLMPQSLAFIIMVIFTVFTVFAALKYDQQVIAIIGLVGAYSVPFLLSDGSGKVLILFSYMTLINIGILIIAFKKYWRLLNLTSFFATWVIFASWYFSSFQVSLHFNIGLTFLFIFFAIFYTAFLSYKLIKRENYEAKDIFSVLSNSFIFYGIGIGMLNAHPVATNYLGLFTLLNAIVHFGVSTLIYKKKLGDKSLFYLILGLVLTFITIAVPIQLNGQWVTLSWAFQAVLLFWLGRSKKVSLYENLSYVVMLLAFFSLIEDWWNYKDVTPFFNPDFLNSLLFVIAFGFIFYLQRKFREEENTKLKFHVLLMNYFVPGVFLFVLYKAIQMEISNYWDLKYLASKVDTTGNGYAERYTLYNEKFMDYETVWVLNFTLLYLSAIFFIIEKKIKNTALEITALVISGLTLFLFISTGLYAQASLIHSYMNPTNYASAGFFGVVVHYISLLILAIFVYRIYIYFISRQEKNRMLFDIFFSILVIWILSAEMLIWLNAFNIYENNKLGLSILWGIYSLLLISYGIWKSKKHLRILAIVLFGITLLKLFFYDIVHLNTIRKTIVFVSLGILLLVISFLYNKYKHLILDDDKK
ncbi:DUF2339 domain-containing protein [Flavobacterium microcysteis]